MNRGFSPPGSKLFRDVLHFIDLHPQDIGPNSVSNICNIQVFCEVYLEEEPSLELFREYFYLNRQNEYSNGPSLELGGVSIQRGETPFFLMRSRQVIPRTRTRHGSTAKILLWLMRTLCPAFAPRVSNPIIRSPTSCQLLIARSSPLPLPKSRLYWGTT